MPTEPQVCLFTIRGEFGHWRKWFTTTSALTYSFPPRTALIGMIGAILGIQRHNVPKVFPLSATRIAVCPLARIEKDMFPIKWRQSPPAISGRVFRLNKMVESFQENLEVVRRPNFLIAFWHQEERLLKELVERLKNKRWVYPPYLGIMGFLADVEWTGYDVAEEIRVDGADIVSVLPLSEQSSKKVDLSESENIIREERVPLEVFPQRTFSHLFLAYLSREAKPIVVKVQQGMALFKLRNSGHVIAFFEQ
jgi:CRISPR-associated protein Cas5h